MATTIVPIATSRPAERNALATAADPVAKHPFQVGLGERVRRARSRRGPAGPFEWLADWNAGQVVRLLDALDAHNRGERYRVSPWLRRAADAN